MSIKLLLSAVVAAALLTAEPVAAAQDIIERKAVVPYGVDDVIIRTEIVRTDDLILPDEAPILYRRLRMAVSRACRQSHNYIEYLWGVTRREERLCKKE